MHNLILLNFDLLPYFVFDSVIITISRFYASNLVSVDLRYVLKSFPFSSASAYPRTTTRGE